MSESQRNTSMMRYAGLATQWMAMMLVGVWGGYKLDHKIGWRVPVFLILFPMISLTLSIWQLMKELNKTKK
jgi:F0F1-type ATP synthase assembly protein I